MAKLFLYLNKILCDEMHTRYQRIYRSMSYFDTFFLIAPIALSQRKQKFLRTQLQGFNGISIGGGPNRPLWYTFPIKVNNIYL